MIGELAVGIERMPQIAAVAQRNQMAVASRDMRGFDSLEVTIVDPWEGG